MESPNFLTFLHFPSFLSILLLCLLLAPNLRTLEHNNNLFWHSKKSAPTPPKPLARQDALSRPPLSRQGAVERPNRALPSGNVFAWSFDGPPGIVPPKGGNALSHNICELMTNVLLFYWSCSRAEPSQTQRFHGCRTPNSRPNVRQQTTRNIKSCAGEWMVFWVLTWHCNIFVFCF